MEKRWNLIGQCSTPRHSDWVLWVWKLRGSCRCDYVKREAASVSHNLLGRLQNVGESLEIQQHTGTKTRKPSLWGLNFLKQELDSDFEKKFRNGFLFWGAQMDSSTRFRHFFITLCTSQLRCRRQIWTFSFCHGNHLKVAWGSNLILLEGKSCFSR